ncbi:Uncharacterised protein [Segatella copri]|nr:Uncharacterised protein [Segatella copri]
MYVASLAALPPIASPPPVKKRMIMVMRQMVKSQVILNRGIFGPPLPRGFILLLCSILFYMYNF